MVYLSTRLFLAPWPQIFGPDPMRWSVPGFDVMAISRPDGLGDIANLGITLSEAKQLLVRVQQQVVAEQANTHATFRPDCRSCGGTCHVRDWHPHRVATLFGEVRVRLPRLVCVGCGCGETGVSWPSHCRSTPELRFRQNSCRQGQLFFHRVAHDEAIMMRAMRLP